MYRLLLLFFLKIKDM